jgi:hypothetical protein
VIVLLPLLEITTVAGPPGFTTTGRGVAVTVAVDGSDVTRSPAGDVPVAVAVSTTEPASMSARVTTYLAEHVVDSPGGNVVTGQVISGGVPEPEKAMSLTLTPVRTVSPVLVTR